MKYLIILCVCISITVTHPFDERKLETWNRRRVSTARPPSDGHRYRFRRDTVDLTKNTKYGLKDGIPYIDHQVNLANSGSHTLDAKTMVSKDFHNNGPLVSAGSINYQHKPSGAGVVLGASHVPSGGTNVNAAGVWNVYRNGGFGVDLKGGYNQHFGGPFGNGPPIYGVEIRGGYAFPRRG